MPRHITESVRAHQPSPAPGDCLFSATLATNPTTKSRPGWPGYVPRRAAAVEQVIATLLRGAGAVTNCYDDLRVCLTFRTLTHQRRDLDNLVKLFLDAANGVLWHDDVQITVLEARVIRGDSSPGIDVGVYVERVRVRHCVACQELLGHRRSRKGYQFCSNACWGESQRSNRAERVRSNGICAGCGTKLEDKRSTRCRACWKAFHAGRGAAQGGGAG